MCNTNREGVVGLKIRFISGTKLFTVNTIVNVFGNHSKYMRQYVNPKKLSGINKGLPKAI